MLWTTLLLESTVSRHTEWCLLALLCDNKKNFWRRSGVTLNPILTVKILKERSSSPWKQWMNCRCTVYGYGTSELWIGRRDFILSCTLYFFPFSRLSSYLLRLSFCLISILLFPCMSVYENTLYISSPCPVAILTDTSFFSQFCGRETRHAQRTLLLALYRKWPFTPFN